MQMTNNPLENKYLWILIILGIALVEELCRRKLIPWLKEKQLSKAAMAAVELAEAIIGRGNGERKLEIALRLMSEHGDIINTQRIIDAVQEAWRVLDLRMIENGEKEAQG